MPRSARHLFQRAAPRAAQGELTRAGSCRAARRTGQLSRREARGGRCRASSKASRASSREAVLAAHHRTQAASPACHNAAEPKIRSCPSDAAGQYAYLGRRSPAPITPPEGRQPSDGEELIFAAGESDTRTPVVSLVLSNHGRLHARRDRDGFNGAPAFARSTRAPARPRASCGAAVPYPGPSSALISQRSIEARVPGVSAGSIASRGPSAAAMSSAVSKS
jgi:hypothetical protein